MADSEKVSSLPSERERFERWFSDEGESPLAVQRDMNGNYRLLQAASAWSTWQAASAGRQELLQALRTFRQATNTLQVAQQDGVNVHGALSAFLGARDMADAAIAKATGEQQ